MYGSAAPACRRDAGVDGDLLLVHALQYSGQTLSI